MSRVVVLQHFPCETQGTIASALEAKGIGTKVVRAFAGEPMPAHLDGMAGVISMGGPMSVYERFSYGFIIQEIRLIEQALAHKKPVLGICLGSQFLATALGANVTKGEQKELGWHPVSLTEGAATDTLWNGIKSPFTAFHWHGDIFPLPQGAVALASSELTECQAFRYGPNAYGLLFHVEVTRQIVREIAASFSDEAKKAGVDPQEVIAQADACLPPLQTIAGTVFHRWASLV